MAIRRRPPPPRRRLERKIHPRPSGSLSLSPCHQNYSRSSPKLKKTDGDAPAQEGNPEDTPVKPPFEAQGFEKDLVETIQREILQSKPNVKWETIAGIFTMRKIFGLSYTLGLAEAKRLLNEAVVLPLLIPDYFQGLRRPWKGVLMTGPRMSLTLSLRLIR